jgi:hypothetical protein
MTTARPDTAGTPEVCQAARAVTAGAGKPALADRPLITPERAGQMVGLFKVLANDSRLRLLHALERAVQLCVSDLADTGPSGCATTSPAPYAWSCCPTPGIS